MKFIVFAVLFAGACVAVPQPDGVAQTATDTIGGATGALNGTNALNGTCDKLSEVVNKTLDQVQTSIGQLRSGVGKYN